MSNLSSEEYETYRQNDRVALLVSHSLVVLMMVCLAVTLMQAAGRVAPDWQAPYLPLLAAVISVEAGYTRRIMRRSADLVVYGMGYYLVEWVVLLVFIRIFTYIWKGIDQLLLDIVAWGQNFALNFFNEEYLFLILFAFIIWMISGSFAKDLMEIEGDEILLNVEDVGSYMSDRRAVRGRLVSRVFWVGFLMVLLASLVRLDIRPIWGDRPVPHSTEANIVVYFILALALLAQSHFAILRASWAWDRVPVGRGMTKNWAIYSVIFLAFIALLAVLLPTRYTMGLLTVINYAGLIFGQVLYFLSLLLLFPIVSLFSLLGRLFGSGSNDEAPPPPELPQFGDAAAPVSGVAWLDLLKSLLFWVVFLSIIGYAFYQYIRQNRELLDKLRGIPILSWLMGSLRRLWGSFRAFNLQIGKAVKSGVHRLRLKRSLAPVFSRRYISLRRLPPREKVLFFYLALVRRGKETGMPRRASQTPNEYKQVLETELVEVSQDLEDITQAFLEARYSRHEITPEQSGLARRWWDHIRQALRTRFRRGQA